SRFAKLQFLIACIESKDALEKSSHFLKGCTSMTSIMLADHLRAVVRQRAHRRVRSSRRVSHKPALEFLEGRVTPTITSGVVAGVLTVSSSFNDPIVISASKGNVQVDGANPGTGAAAASTITSIVITGGPGGNTIDVRAATPTNFTNLKNISATSGGGTDLFQANTLIPGTYDAQNTNSLTEFYGTATNVTEDIVHNQIDFDGILINTPNHKSADAFLDVNMTNLTIEPAPGIRIIEDNGIVGDGISRAFNASAGVYTDFRNPTGTLTVLDTNTGVGGSTYEYQGIDPANPPAHIVLDTNNQKDTLVFGGSATNVTEDLVNGVVNLDGQAVGIPNDTQSNAVFNTVMTNFTIEPKAGNHRIIEDSPTANSGYSRALNASTGQFTDFNNPSGTLTVQDINATGGSIYEFQGLDAVNPPANIVLNANNLPDLLQFDGTATNVIEDLVHSTLSLDNLVIGIPNRNLTDVFLNINMTNLTIEPTAGNHRVLEDGLTPGNGVSRAFNATTNTYTDFNNPSGTLTVKDINATGGSIYEFQGLDALNPPAHIVLDTGGNADMVILDVQGTYTNVVEDLVNSTVSLDGLVIGIPGSGPANLFIDENMVNFTIEPGLGNHRIIQDDGTPDNGISQAYNASNGTYTNFRNPSGTLTVKDTNLTGGSTYEFKGLDAIGRPANIVFDTNNNADLLEFDGTATNVIFDVPSSTYNIDGVVIQMPNRTQAQILDNIIKANFTKKLAAGANEFISPSPDPLGASGYTRALNANTFLYVDFRNPTSSLTFQTTSAGNTTVNFSGVDPIGLPPNIFFLGQGPNNTLIKTGLGLTQPITVIGFTDPDPPTSAD